MLTHKSFQSRNHRVSILYTEEMKKIIVAIDGHSSCGKSTMAKELARRVDYIYVDTGAMYRAVTLFAMEEGLFDGEKIDTERLAALLPQQDISFRAAADGKQHVHLNGRDVEESIRGMEVSQRVSPIATLGFVREAMVAQQQEMGKEKGLVMDGRDIGTKVFPDAELKVFVTASAEVRAQRRYDELVAKGDEVSFEEILKNVEERDYIDSHRAINPLRRADDALLLDNSEMTIAAQNEWLVEAFRRATQS